MIKECVARMQKMKEQKPILSISLLVSNRIDTIRKCMESIRPILEQIPTELIAIDTVGEKTDGSIEIVKEYTNQIYYFKWCNDFSAARNEGLKRAKGEWFLFLDDDEWFHDVVDIIHFFQSGEYKKFNSATYKIHDYRSKGEHYSVGRLSRMVKLEKNTKFCGVVHEYLTPMYLPCKDLESFIYHYGYVFDTEEKAKKHTERNLSLLLPEFEKNPQDMRLRLQVIQEYMCLKEDEAKAEALCKETFEMDSTYHTLSAFQWIMTAYVRLAERNEENLAEVLHRVAYLHKIAQFSHFTTIATGIVVVRTLQKLKRYKEILEWLLEIEQAYQYLLQHPEKQIEERILDFDVLLETSVIAELWKDGILAFLAIGDKENAIVWTKKRQVLLQQPMVTISLLVSNNITTIRKCFESLQPLLQTVPSELIVVDTVGEKNSDGSLAVAKEYTKNIVNFPWCNDFALARNAGLEKAKGEWFLFLDDDEWFEDISELVEFFQTGEYLNYYSATYRIRNYKDKEGKDYSVAELGRMIKRGKNTKFIGKIHETFSEIYLPCKTFSAFVHHYGYVYNSEEEKQKHQQRNLTLLKEELESNPYNLRYRTQMAMELATFDNESALKFCEETFQLCAEKKDTPEFQWQLALVFRLYEALGVNDIEAVKTYQQLKKMFGYSRTTENSISYQLTRIHIICKNYTQAYPYVLQYFESLQYLREHPEEQQLQMAADSFRYQSKECYLEMLEFGAYCAWQAKAYPDAWFFYSELPWEQQDYYNKESLWYVFQMATEYFDARTLFKIIQRVMKNTELKKEFAMMMQNPVIKQMVNETLETMKRNK